jgi:hypothetical protein
MQPVETSEAIVTRSAGRKFRTDDTTPKPVTAGTPIHDRGTVLDLDALFADPPVYPMTVDGDYLVGTVFQLRKLHTEFGVAPRIVFDLDNGISNGQNMPQGRYSVAVFGMIAQEDYEVSGIAAGSTFIMKYAGKHDTQDGKRAYSDMRLRVLR